MIWLDREVTIHYPWVSAPEFAKPLQVAEGILWFRVPLPMPLDHVNVYVLEDNDGWTVVDTGLATTKTKEMWQKIFSGPLFGKKIKRLIVTHHHPDHVGLAGWFQKEYNASLWMTRTAWLMARMLCLDEQKTPPAETLEFWTRAGMRLDILEERKKGKPFNFADAVSALPLGFRRIVDNEEFEIGNRVWKVRIGNGHAPEHATLWSTSDQIVLAGDQIISSISPNLGVYATEPDANPVREWIDTCHKLSQFASDDHLALSGHKLPFKGLKFRLQQMVENHEHALERLINFLEKPHTAEECFSVLFGKSIQNSEYGLALVESVAHVNYLFLEGTVSRVMDRAGAFKYQSL